MTLQVLSLAKSLVCFLGQSSIACREKLREFKNVKKTLQIIAPQFRQPEARAIESFRFFNNATSREGLSGIQAGVINIQISRAM